MPCWRWGHFALCGFCAFSQTLGLLVDLARQESVAPVWLGAAAIVAWLVTMLLAIPERPPQVQTFHVRFPEEPINLRDLGRDSPRATFDSEGGFHLN